MADYCTVAEIKAGMPESPLASSTDFDVALGEMITAASRMIDRYVGRWQNYFYPSSDDETRYFDGSGEIEQWIDSCASLTSVSVAESGGVGSTDYTDWTENTDFYVQPYNYGALGMPIDRLIIDWNGDKYSWTSFRKAVKVTGIFGYSLTPPDDVNQACKIQAFRWFMRAKQGYQDAGASAEIGQLMFVQQLDPDVKSLLAPYRTDNII